MHYVMSVIDNLVQPGSPDEPGAIDAFNDRLRAEGYWVFGAGLELPEAATVVDNRDGTPLVTDGPYVESKEYVAGFWIIQAPDLDVALDLVTAASRACNRRIELRPIDGDPA